MSLLCSLLCTLPSRPTNGDSAPSSREAGATPALPPSGEAATHAAAPPAASVGRRPPGSRQAHAHPWRQRRCLRAPRRRPRGRAISATLPLAGWPRPLRLTSGRCPAASRAPGSRGPGVLPDAASAQPPLL
ncbi:hypothetical protein DAI22_02g283450 [Oryza sativa Japonica Group]|nr:hypothetical protein DAI22_02g283450 [Oryza sativa Japonica Group]